jgi:lipopolysaccharide/colanic/teichoic acid biosynthesis glycosyltransferase
MRADSRKNDLNRDLAVRELTKSLLRRMRSTDVVGWLDGHSIGVFLPETDIDGARLLARDTCEEYSYQIYVYPSPTDAKNDFKIGGSGHRQQDERDRASAPVPAAEGRKQAPFHREMTVEQFESISRGQAVASSSHSAGAAGSVVGLIMPPSAPAWKRVYDILGATVLLIALSPLFAVVALYIKVVSPGPVFFRQDRVGYLGRPFTIWKFRTMKANAACDVHRSHLKNLINGDKVLEKLERETDGRWIPLAGLLRKTCLDELPQLFNVLRGEMSLIGPRPVPDYEVEEYSLWQHQRFYSVPGMTGLWQVSGKNRLTFSQMMRLDARYSRKYNFAMDQRIFVKTVPAILGQVLDSVRGKISSKSTEKSVSIWKRSLSDLVRQVFL